MKAGTTWLYEQLKDHPEIYFTPEKEIHYFANKSGIENQLSHRNRVNKLKHILEKYSKSNPVFILKNIDEIVWYTYYAKSREINNDWYERLFSQNKHKRFCADFSNLYCQMDRVGWANVHKVAKNIKVIYTLRDPLRRLWSHYKFHFKWIGKEDEVIKAGFEQFKDLLDKSWFWVNAEYGRNYKLIMQNLERNQVDLLYFEDFRENPLKKLMEIYRFIGVSEVSHNEASIYKRVNITKEFDMPTEWREYAVKKLAPLYNQMLSLGITHSSWEM